MAGIIPGHFFEKAKQAAWPAIDCEDIVTTYWLSFLDQARPVGKKATGVVIVEAEEPDAALAFITQHHLHPGGDATIEDITHRAPSAEWFNRILSNKEARDVTRLMCIASQDRYDDDDDED